MLSPATILQNRYRIVRELGHGGMGTVYEAVDQRVNSIIALKQTTATRNDDARRAFEREAALLANLRHPALPKVMDFFSELNNDFLVMEFIPGYDLAELLDLRGEPFPQSQVLRWANDLLRVLEYLHGQTPPILHRDIKPSNLKLTKQGEIFLLDFGLAKGAVGQMPTLVTNPSVRGYTPVYASLEQIHGHGTDPRSDIYSLAATLYHLLAATPPVDAPTRFNATEDDAPDPLQPVNKLNPQASANVAAVIQQAMAISRKQRPFSAAEMRKALLNAAEEDERNSAEQEYARAEAKRREMEAERRRAEAEAAEREADRLRDQEAETRKKEQARREAEARELAEAERARVAEAARQAEFVRKPIPPTIPTPEPILPTPPPSVKTIPAPPPERFHSDRSDGRETQHEPESEPASTNKLIWLAATAVVLIILGGLAYWLISSSSSSPNANQTLTSTGQPTENQNNPPPGMVYVSGGAFSIGNSRGDLAEQPIHQETVKAFYIDKYEVTNEEYEKFVKASYRRVPGTWANGIYPAGAGRKPVTGVSWDDAREYARWAGKRLPTEQEWEFAAHGRERTNYPWGEDWKPGMANAGGASRELVQVGSYQGASPFGAYDMVGNAWEWTASDFQPYPGGRLPPDQPRGELKTIRGGSYESTKDYATTTYRVGWPARGAKTYDQTGFRCVKDLP